MLIQDICLSVSQGNAGFRKSSTVTATRALILDDTVLWKSYTSETDVIRS